MSSRHSRQVAPSKQLTPRGSQWAVREGEGTPIAVRVRYDVGVEGQSVGQLEVDVGSAPVPDRRYVADMYGVYTEEGMFQLVFGQRRLKSKDPRSMLIIQLSRVAVQQILANVDQVKNPTFVEIVKAMGRAPAAPNDFQSEPAQTVELSANLVLTAMAGDEAVIDFYKASPFSFHAAPHRGKLSVDPIVRIETRSDITMGVIQELRARVASEAVRE